MALANVTSNITTAASNVPAGAAAPVFTVPNAVVAVCFYPAVGVPGTNTAPIFQDQAGAIPMNNPFTTDSEGRFSFWVASGTYAYTVQDQSGANVGTFALTVTIGSPSNSVVTTPAGNQVITQPAGTFLSVNNFYTPSEPFPVTGVGAIGDGTTDNTLAFTTMENSSLPEYFLPQGQYKTTQASLLKRYYGPGSLLLAGVARAGRGSTEENQRISDLDGVNVFANFSGPTTMVWLGDSICYGFGVAPTEAYMYKIQQWLNFREGGIGQGSYRCGGLLDNTTVTGTVTAGTNGPLKNSYILSPGATISFTADNARNLGVWFQRQAGGGTLTLSIGGSPAGTVSTAGAPANDIFQQLSLGGLPKTKTYTWTASVGPCEVTGFSALPGIDGQISPMVLWNQCRSGYATTNFVSSPVLTSIAAQTTYKASGFWSYVIALGTNNIYNPPTATSSAQYKADIETIIAGMGASAIPILAVPLRAQAITYAPVLEPFDNYRDVIYQVARERSLRVIDFSELDLASRGAYQSDGLHPNSFGHAMMADYIFKQLGFGGVASTDISANLTFASGATAFGLPYAPPSVTLRGGRAFLSGVVNVSGIAKNSAILSIGSFPAKPSYQKIFSTVSQTLPGSVELVMDINGNITLFDYSATSITYISLDGISYPISEN